MSFAQRYLDLVTECSKELKKQKTVSFFGVDAPWTDEGAYDIIRGSIEEWEDSVSWKFKNNTHSITFEFNSYDDCLFNKHCLKDIDDPSGFILEYFKYVLKEIKDNKELLKEIFEKAKEENKLVYFSTMYSTAVEAKIHSDYENKYKELKASYPGLPYYPSLGFGYSLDDYYESSTC